MSSFAYPIPSTDEMKDIIDKTVCFVIKNGKMFEDHLKLKQGGNLKYAFLDQQRGGQDYLYYQFKLKIERLRDIGNGPAVKNPDIIDRPLSESSMLGDYVLSSSLPASLFVSLISSDKIGLYEPLETGFPSSALTIHRPANVDELLQEYSSCVSGIISQVSFAKSLEI